MKDLLAQKQAYSSIVGGGVKLVDKLSGVTKFNIMVIGTTSGISKNDDAIISERIIKAWNKGEES